MKFIDILKRINGLGIGGVSISWNPSRTDKGYVKEIISFLEDRRVLYNPSEMEVPRHCVESVLEIRRFLTGKIGQIQGEKLSIILKGMQSACRKFLDTVGVQGDVLRFAGLQGHWANWTFNSAVGELRGVFGMYLAELSVMYKLDIEDNLASILPVSDIDTKEEA
jgi:Family of unknown function (DUF6650)